MNERIKILCVDDEPNVLKSLRRLFVDEEQYEILLAESGEDGLMVLEEEEDIRLVISDYRMTGMNGVEFLAKVCEKWPDTMRIVLSGFADTAAVVESINLGRIYKFIPKPWNGEDLKSTVSTALQHQALQVMNKELNKELQDKNQQLKNMNMQLEHLVKKRTRSLEIRNRVLQISQGVLDVLSIAVVGIDEGGMIVQCNEQAQSLFPHGYMGPIGHHWDEIFPEEVKPLLSQLTTSTKPEKWIELDGQKFYARVKRMVEPFSNGIVFEFIPEFCSIDKTD